MPQLLKLIASNQLEAVRYDNMVNEQDAYNTIQKYKKLYKM